MATSHTSGAEALVALTQGYRAGFAATAVVCVISLLAALLLPRQYRPTTRKYHVMARHLHQ